MSFKSSSSKQTAESTVNNLLATFLPGSGDSGKRSKSRASTINDQIKRAQKLQVLQEQARKLKRKEKAKTRAKLRISKDEASRATKLAKLRLGEGREVKQVVDSAVATLQTWDNDNASEEEELEQRIIRLKSQQRNRRKEKRDKNSDFKSKVKRGVLSVPGLTPGLAPVGATDSESEDSDDGM